MFKLSIFIGYLSSALGIVGGIFLQPLLLKSFGDMGYVYWTTFIITLGYVSNGFVGLQTYLTVSIAKTSNIITQKELLATAKGLLLLLGLAVPAFLYMLLATASLELGLITDPVFILATCLTLFKLLFETLLSYFSGNNRPIVPKIYDLTLKIFNVAIIIFVYFFEIDVKSALVFYISSQLVNVILLTCFYRGEIKPFRFTISSDLIKKLMYGALPFVMISVPQSFVQTLDILLISKYLNETTATSVIFYLKIFSIVFISQNILLSIFYPTWSKYLSENKTYELKKSFLSINIFFILIVLTVSMVLNNFSVVIFSHWLSRDNIYIDENSLILLTSMVLLQVIRTSFYFLNNSIKVDKKHVAIYWMELLIHFILGVYAIERYGMNGVFLTSSVICFMTTATLYAFLKKYI
ncbi:hypothetical protein EJ350_20310 [Vibrio parahaemolyticus]|nr:hypothetical protein [Vibrio parahaemolyticus]EGR0909896.1 hypothetical protein [Vibrio parahaemolyticus]EGR1593916.1 hypothetical protein [Vibrio parahaemolyticus]EGR1724805.1 hypothetical protein [Vibrio parahaemolyticus]